MRSKKGNLSVVFAPSCSLRSPSKALPEFLVRPLAQFLLFGGRPRTLVGITSSVSRFTQHGLQLSQREQPPSPGSSAPPHTIQPIPVLLLKAFSLPPSQDKCFLSLSSPNQAPLPTPTSHPGLHHGPPSFSDHYHIIFLSLWFLYKPSQVFPI